MRVTEATMADIPELCDLLELLFTQEAEFRPDRSLQTAGLQQIIDFQDRGRILVLRQGASLIGMVSMLFTISTALGGRVAQLEDMVLDTGYRGRGMGTALLEAAIDLAKSHGGQRITLLTDRTNQSAQRVYERHGFSLSEMVPMRLILGP